MYHQHFDENPMSLSEYGTKQNLGPASSEEIPGFLLNDDRGDFVASSSSSAIPINSVGRFHQQMHLSESQESSGSSYPAGMTQEIPAFSSFIGHNGNGAPRYAQNRLPPGYVGSLPHDPYSSPLIHGMPPQAISRDHLSMVYGQSCPESVGYAPHPGMSPLSGPPLPVLYTQPNGSYINAAEVTRSPPPTATGLSASMFQFRTSHPTSSEQIVEKQKKRKESHNAVERRRRDHINEMIQQLGSLVEDGEGEAGRMNKGEILQKAVERIRMLQMAVELQGTRLAQVDPNFKLPEIVFEQPSIPEEP